MRANLRADTVFQRGDDLAAGRVILGIGGEDQQHVEREPDGITLNLDVALLHDVKQAHLNFSGEVRQLVDRENAAVGAGEQAVVQGELVGQIAAAASRFDGINVPDDVGNGHIRGGELFHVSLIARQPSNRCVVAAGGDQLAAGAANRPEGIVIDLAAGDHGNFRVQELHQATEDAAFRLAAQAEQDEIMSRQDSVHDLWDDGIFVTVDAREECSSFAQPA